MRERRPDKSHAVAWALALIVGLPLLYLLSVGPLVYFTVKPTGMVYTITGSGQSFRGTTVPKWVEAYIGPYQWVHWKTPLRVPLSAYDRLWERDWEVHHP